MDRQRLELGTHGAPRLLLPSTQVTEYPVGTQQMFKGLQREESCIQSELCPELVTGRVWSHVLKAPSSSPEGRRVLRWLWHCGLFVS